MLSDMNTEHNMHVLIYVLLLFAKLNIEQHTAMQSKTRYTILQYIDGGFIQETCPIFSGIYLKSGLWI